MEKGIYTDLSNHDYHNKPECVALSSSELRKPTMAHLKASRESREPPTKPMVDGSAFHTLTLQPDRAKQEVAVEKSVTKAKRDKSAMEGISLISYDDKDMIDGMIASLRAHKTASSIIWHKNALIEESIFWKDPTHGFLCKCRNDIRRPDLGFIADLKSTQDASADKFHRDALWNYGYYWQGKWYLTGTNAAQAEVYYQNFLFICVEKSEPHAVAVYRADMDNMYNAGLKIEPILEQYAKCLKTDKWPAYPDAVLDLGV